MSQAPFHRQGNAPAGTAPATGWGLTEAVALAVLTVIGAAMRFYNLGEKSLWYDEAVVYHIVQGGWREILTQNALENSAPPLYALALGLLTGPDASEAALRALSALAGVAAIPLIYLLAREFVAPRVAWLAPLLLAVAPTQVMYSQQLREYSLTTAVATLMLLVFTRFARDPDGRRALHVALVAVLGLLTQYGLGLLLTGLNIACLGAMLLARRPAASYRRWLYSQLPAAAVAVAIYLTVVRYQMPVVAEAGIGYLRPYYWDSASTPLWAFLAAPQQNIVGFAFPGMLFLLLFSLGLVAFLLGARSGLATAMMLLPAGLTALLAAVGAYPYGAIRQDMFLTPAVYLCAVLGADRLAALLPRRWPAAVPLVALMILAVVMALPGAAGSLSILRQSPGYQPMRQVVEALAGQIDHDRERTIYVYYNAIPAFRYYWRDRNDPWIAGVFHRSFMDEEKSREQMLAVQEQ
ncbi:MAG: glycosyltransferase family 39 protein, partial [Gammaproteobacteria bacterium]|nr:glycosyltransferase family 39 protein [Gammaproteobacteria bacterium]